MSSRVQSLGLSLAFLLPATSGCSSPVEGGTETIKSEGRPALTATAAASTDVRELLSFSQAIIAKLEAHWGIQHRGGIEVRVLSEPEWIERFGSGETSGITTLRWFGAERICLRERSWRYSLGHELVHVIGRPLLDGVPVLLEEGIAEYEGSRASGLLESRTFLSLSLVATGRTPNIFVSYGFGSYGGKRAPMRGRQGRPRRLPAVTDPLPWDEFWDLSRSGVRALETAKCEHAYALGFCLAMRLSEECDLAALLRSTRRRHRARALEEALTELGLSRWEEVEEWARGRFDGAGMAQWAILKVDDIIRDLAVESAAYGYDLDGVLGSLDLHVHLGEGKNVDEQPVTLDVSHHPEVVRIVEDALR